MSTDLVARRYISQYSAQDTLGIETYVSGQMGDADANTVTVSLHRSADNTVVFSRPATRFALGQYGVTLSSAETSVPGQYYLDFAYSIGGVAQQYRMDIEVGVVAPAYDMLSPDFKAVVESVWERFADLYDSPYGGPHLQVYMQANFGRQRLATLLRNAIGRLNTVSQPHMTFGLDRPYPFADWGAVLEQGLYIEVLRHLVRSYTEQPEAVLGTNISRFDRRDYQQRWMTVLEMELVDFKLAMDSFKMAFMGLGNVRVLVAGGAYGNLGPTAVGAGGEAAARGYYFARRFS